MNRNPNAPVGLSRRHLLQATALFSAGALVGCDTRYDTQRRPFKLAASVYVGWMPWMFAAEKGLLRTAGQSHGVDISLVRGSYVESIDQFMAGHVDAVVMTNIDAMAILPGSATVFKVKLKLDCARVFSHPIKLDPEAWR